MKSVKYALKPLYCRVSQSLSDLQTIGIGTICIENIHILCDMYKNCEKIYISVIICIENIHILCDMYKNCEKIYISF